MYTGQVGQQSYLRAFPVAYPGMWEGMGEYRGMPYINSATGKQPSYTITPPATIDANAEYVVALDGVSVRVMTGGSTTPAQLGTLLYNALRAEAQVFRKAEIALNSTTGVVTLTSRLLNTPIAITTNSGSTTNDLTIANPVTPGTSQLIPFGRFVGRLPSFPRDPISGFSPAALVDHASNYTVVGATLKQFLERPGIGPNQPHGYPFMSIMNVLDRCGETEGVWMECVEPDIDVTDSVYIAIGAGNQGKVTKTAGGNMDISTKAKFKSMTQQAFGMNLVLVWFNFD